MKPAATGAALFAVALSAACASTPAAGVSSPDDPYEGFNRQMFAFNNGLDRYALKPASDAYKAVTPKVARKGVSNFLSNIRSPVIFVNDVLQAEPSRAVTTFTRFSLNSTVGILGVFDVATEMGIERHREDFGQTLAVWGVESGPYLVLPVIGPTTPRDVLGIGVDQAFDPLTWVEIGNDSDTDLGVRIGLGAFRALNTRVQLEDQINALNAQPEPYIAMRRIYSSSRQTEILNGRIDEDTAYDDLPDFDEFED